MLTPIRRGRTGRAAIDTEPPRVLIPSDRAETIFQSAGQCLAAALHSFFVGVAVQHRAVQFILSGAGGIAGDGAVFTAGQGHGLDLFQLELFPDRVGCLQR